VIRILNSPICVITSSFWLKSRFLHTKNSTGATLLSYRTPFSSYVPKKRVPCGYSFLNRLEIVSPNSFIEKLY
jgi:hypothetical protein